MEVGTGMERKLTLVAAVGWIVVGVQGVRDITGAGSDDWEVAYTVLVVALAVAASATLGLVALAGAGSPRPRLRLAGLAVGVLGCALAVVGAWAYPAWMTLLGAGFALLAGAAAAGRRRPLVFLAAGQLAGVVVLIAGIEAQIGARDSYGDFPAAGGIALVFVAVATIAAVVGVARSAENHAAGAGAGTAVAR